MEVLTAKTLRNELWKTLLAVKSKRLDPIQANSIASQSREILSTTNTQIKICEYADMKMPDDLLKFAGAKK